jgi:hypothetical protein
MTLVFNVPKKYQVRSIFLLCRQRTIFLKFCASIWEICTCKIYFNFLIDGARVADLAPNLAALVSKRHANSHSVKDGLGGEWLRDCGPNLGAAAVQDFFLLWSVISDVLLSPEREDSFRWRWTADGVYSTKSAYGVFFAGTTVAPVASQIWQSRAPYSCKFFVWLASRNRCWTADRLQRRGLPHPAACPLCDQEPESIQHLLLGCTVAWASVVVLADLPSGV